MPVTVGQDLSLEDHPLKQPSSKSPHILIIGAGVIGLTNAWVLLDRGYRVTILSNAWVNDENRLTSQIAGALWEYPPAVCGQHTNAISLAHSKRWCMVAYHIWDAIAASPSLSEETGVRMMPADFFFPNMVEEDDHELGKMREIMASGVRGFYRGSDIIEDRSVDPDYGAVDAYEIMAPIIDTDKAMYWLTGFVQRKGAKLVTETINGDLLDREESLRARFGADVIINCTGLQGYTLAGDKTVYPIRGGLIRVVNDGTDFPKVKAALTITADAAGDVNEIVFLVPRNDNILLIGGIAQPYESKLDLTLESPIIRRMRERCENFLPSLTNARLDPDYPFAQGLRPFRESNVRVERELRNPKSRVIHSYGQGGAGWSLSFGCASDVASLVEEVLAGVPARGMDERVGDWRRTTSTHQIRACL